MKILKQCTIKGRMLNIGDEILDSEVESFMIEKGIVAGEVEPKVEEPKPKVEELPEPDAIEEPELTPAVEEPKVELLTELLTEVSPPIEMVEEPEEPKHKKKKTSQD